ncbi:MAG: DUF58 domain-containing protein [Terriglobales bacterium]
MTDQSAMIPELAEGRARPAKRLGFSFGYRFFIFLLIGLVWLVPAFADIRFAYAMIGWDLLLLLAWAADLLSLPKPRALLIRRTWLAPPALSVRSQVRITALNESRSTLHLRILDNLPSSLRSAPPQLELTVRSGQEREAEYTIQPSKRGTAAVSQVYLRYQGPMRIAERWAVAALPQQLTIYPNLQEAKRHAVYLIRSRQIELEKRFSRIRGAGHAFESLREYREGDDFGDICWTATARRGKLVTRLYELEKSQTIWIVLDTGRLMRTRVASFSKLDHAANAALALGQVALYTGDRVGLLAYARNIRQRIPAARGSSHLRQLMEALATVHEDEWEADHLQAASRLLRDQKRRSLVVWITDLAETAMTPEVIEAAAALLPTHLVLFVVIGQPDLQAAAARRPTDVDEMYEVSAAQEIVHRRELLLARLRERGALAVEAKSGELAPLLVNSYLQIKQKSQL